LPFRSHCKPGLETLIFGATLDWPRHWRKSRSEDAAGVVAALNTDARFADYYLTTLGFIDFSEKNHDWFTKRTHLDYA
jgi:hypothetical protein